MPFHSQAQRGLMYARHPKIAQRWREESGPQRGLPPKLNPAANPQAPKVRRAPSYMDPNQPQNPKFRRQHLVNQFVQRQRNG